MIKSVYFMIKSVYLIKNYLSTFHAPILFCYHKMDLPIAQENKTKAKSVFGLDDLQNFQVHQIETSIKDIKSLQEMTSKIFSLLC